MSKINSQPGSNSARKPETSLSIRQKKQNGEKIVMTTCYDSTFATLVSRAAVDMVLVGDSAGNVMMGYEDTLEVTLDDMCFFARSVARKLHGPFLVVDMPFLSYQISNEQALESAKKLVQKGRAQAVKLEGGAEVCERMKAIVSAGVPVVGHLGFTPQSIHALGGYKVQGRGEEASQLLLEDAKAIELAGAMALVLEMVPEKIASEISKTLSIPVIGIGAGVGCDGQVLVLQDILGMDPGFKPKFVKHYTNLSETVVGALNEFSAEVKASEFPSTEHGFQ